VNPDALSAPLRLLRAGVHLLVATLLVVIVGRTLTGDQASATAVVAASLLVGLVYAIGPAVTVVRTTRAGAVVWLGVLLAAWLVLLTLTSDGVWLAFPLFLLELHLLPAAIGVAAVIGTTVAAILGFAGHEGATPAAVVGPVLGAAVATATVLGYGALYRESEQRQRLIEELTETRAELAAAERTAGVHAERERLSREIHDTLAQGLASIQLLLRAAGRALPDDPGVAATYVDRARQTAQDNLVEARRVVRALAPAALETATLPAALQRLCETTADQTGLDLRLDVDGEAVALPPSYDVALLRIAQSGVANVVRHARADRARLTLSYLDTHVRLDVVDDGVGFDPGTARDLRHPDGGFGLAAMGARARELGGSFAVESAPGKGTALAASFPYVEPEAPGDRP